MKIPYSMITAGALCLAIFAHKADAQSSGAAGSNPFGRIYAPPSNPQPLPARDAMLPVAPGGYNGGVMVPGMAVPYNSEPVEPNHKLNRGDKLSFRVVEDRDNKPPESLAVTDSGEVNIPLIGPVAAAGKSVAQLSAEVKARLEREYYYHATVVMGLDRWPRDPAADVFTCKARCLRKAPWNFPSTKL